MKDFRIMLLLPLAALSACDDTPASHPPTVDISLEETAAIFSSLPIDLQHLREVHDAVSASSGNGYDEEYTLRDLISSPGAGVGDDPVQTRADAYDRPLRELLRSYLENRPATRASALPADSYLHALEDSDAQIFWPFHENWDGRSYPVITWQPEGDATTNTGWELVPSEYGGIDVQEVIVSEEMAMQRPVWVLNRNDDSSYKTLEVLRREDPDWGTGGSLVLKSGAGPDASEGRTLYLKDFTMNRNYDNWFAGASEFFIKVGSVEGFTASTEAEMLLYQPTVTDFMMVVRRSEKGTKRKADIVLVGDWTDQLESFALMITEDDGGTRTTWKSSATVKVQSKSYGYDISIPFNSRDDIVWRGQLSSRYFARNNSVSGNFGDVSLTFQIR